MAEHNPNTICRNCETPFYAVPYQLKIGLGLFCSHICANTYGMRDEAERFWSFVDKSYGCWLWKGGLNKNGYGRFARSSGPTISAHRFAWELAHGPIPEGKIVCHHCDNPPCVRDEDLFLGTHLDNSLDRDAKGRTACGERSAMYTHPEIRPKGERHGQAKLTDEAVREIRASQGQYRGVLRDMARKYGVTTGLIGHIVHGRAWTHIQ
jgi:hypothetical protein